MLNFLGLAPEGRWLKKRPRSFRMYLELANVAARGEEVKYLFVNPSTVCQPGNSVASPFPKRYIPGDDTSLPDLLESAI
jgi:hypothetical protein